MKKSLLVLILFLPGCVGLSPASMGKTHYDVKFSDVTPEQATNYSMEIKAPAGAELASITGMRYVLRPDGTWEIAVSQDQTTDTTGQAAMLTELSRQQLEAFQAGLNALAPFLSQYLDAKVRQGEIKADVAKDALSKIDPAQLTAILEALSAPETIRSFTE